MAWLTRYFRLYAYFLRFSFSKALEFRFDFFFRIGMDLVYYVIQIGFYQVIYLHTQVLGGWDRHQMMIFTSGYLMVDALFMTIASNNFFQLPNLVNKGDLDYYLVRPISTLFFVTLRDFAANSFVNLIMAIGIFVWCVHGYPGPMGPGKIALFLLLILNGTYLYACVRLLLMIPIFWTHSARGLDQVFWSLTKCFERPDGIFRGWARVLFSTLLPFCLMASFPARLVVEDFSWLVFFHLAVVTAVATLTIRWLWALGLRSYSSASS